MNTWSTTCGSYKLANTTVNIVYSIRWFNCYCMPELQHDKPAVGQDGTPQMAALVMPACTYQSKAKVLRENRALQYTKSQKEDQPQESIQPQPAQHQHQHQQLCPAPACLLLLD